MSIDKLMYEFKEDVHKKLKKTWWNMIYRCTNPNDSKYKYYSKKGVSKEWKLYENFKKDMLEELFSHIIKHGFNDTTLDRINNEKGYSKENCRWATWDIQRKNTQKWIKIDTYPFQTWGVEQH